MRVAELADVGENVAHGGIVRLDITNRQGWMYRRFAKKLDWSNQGLMNEVVDIETVREALRRIMGQKGVKPTTLSLMVGRNKSLVKDLFDRNSDIGVNTLSKLAGALDVSVADLISAPGVPIVGYIGAGGSIIFEDLGSDEQVVPPHCETHFPALQNKVGLIQLSALTGWI